MIKLTVLGSGGTTNTPRPGCQCRVCTEAREKGLPYSRNGPALFLHGVNTLFDAPPHIVLMLNRADIQRVDHLFLTHWHPDHTLGLRFVEQMNFSVQTLRPHHVTQVYLAPDVLDDLRTNLPAIDWYWQRLKVIAVHELSDGQSADLGDVTVTCLYLGDSHICGFLIERGRKRVLYAPCNTLRRQPGDDLVGLDLAIMETGWFEQDLDGNLILPLDHFLRQREISFEKTIARLERMKPRQAVLTHIEEVNARSYDDYKALEREGLAFAYDGMEIEL